MEKNYNRLLDDIDKYDVENNVFMYNNLLSIKRKIDNLELITKRELSEQDFLVVLLKVQDKLQRHDHNADKDIRKKVNELDNYLDSYFTDKDLDVKKLSSLTHINGFVLDDLEEELKSIRYANNTKNPVALFIKILSGLTFLISFIFLFYGTSTTLFNAFISGLLGIVLSFVLFGIAEMIQILHDIRKKMYK